MVNRHEGDVAAVEDLEQGRVGVDVSASEGSSPGRGIAGRMLLGSRAGRTVLRDLGETLSIILFLARDMIWFQEQNSSIDY